MAFGDLLGNLSITAGSVVTPFNATGSVAVAVDDLVVAVFAQQTALTVTGVTDNLGNTYTATNAGTDNGNATGRCFYSRVTTAGTLTTVAGACTGSANDAAFAVSCFAGPFATSPLDANLANISDLASPFACPATGTLAQADELVIGWGACNQGFTTYAATSPNLLRANVATANIAAVIGSQVVAATTTVTPTFTDANALSSSVWGTSTFKKAAGGAAATSLLRAPPSFLHMLIR